MDAGGVGCRDTITRWLDELTASVTRQRRWTLARLCEAVDLVVAMQRLALTDRHTYDEAVLERLAEVRIWLYELMIAAAAMGFDEVAPTLLGALPGVSMGPYEELLAELGRLSVHPRQPGKSAVASGGGR